jgi:hypothetical protein
MSGTCHYVPRIDSKETPLDISKECQLQMIESMFVGRGKPKRELQCRFAIQCNHTISAMQAAPIKIN